MFYDRDNVHHRFLFSFQSLYEQCAFCIVPTALLSFYENKQKVLDCRHLLCAFIGRSLALCVCVFFFLSLSLVPNLANLPSKESSKVDQAVADLDLRWGMLSPSPSQTCFLRKTLRDRRAGRFPYALPPPPHNLQYPPHPPCLLLGNIKPPLQPLL